MTDTLTVQATSPSASYVFSLAGLYFRPGGARVAPQVGLAPAISGAAVFTTTPVPGATYVACAYASMPGQTLETSGYGADCKTGLSPDGLASLAPPAATNLVGVASAGISTTTDFTWNAIPSGVNLLIIEPSPEDPTEPHYFILTSKGDSQIPDLTALGLGLPKGAMYEARVLGFAPFTSIDAALGSNAYADIGVQIAQTTAPFADGQLTYGQAVTFTTAQ